MYLLLILLFVNVLSGVIVGIEIVELLGRIIFNFKLRKWYMKYKGKMMWKMYLI